MIQFWVSWTSSGYVHAKRFVSLGAAREWRSAMVLNGYEDAVINVVEGDK